MRQEGGYNAYQRPVAIDGVEIGVTDARVLDVDEDLIWARLLDWDLLVFYGTAGLVDDLRPLLFRNGTHCDDLSLLVKRLAY